MANIKFVNFEPKLVTPDGNWLLVYGPCVQNLLYSKAFLLLLSKYWVEASKIVVLQMYFFLLSFLPILPAPLTWTYVWKAHLPGALFQSLELILDGHDCRKDRLTKKNLVWNPFNTAFLYVIILSFLRTMQISLQKICFLKKICTKNK